MAVADLVHGVAMEVHDPPARGIDQINSLGALQHIQARCRQRLVQEPAGILIQQCAGLRIDVAALPGGTRVAQIDVTLAAVHAGMLSGWRAGGKRAGIAAWNAISIA